jgi:hypothetical protein
MKQKKLIQEIYEACLSHDNARLLELQIKEYHKIFKRKEKGKSVAKPKYTLIW